VSASYWKCFAR